MITFSKDQRVQFHPATDLWMRGARYGAMHEVTETHIIVIPDKLPDDKVRVPVADAQELLIPTDPPDEAPASL